MRNFITVIDYITQDYQPVNNLWRKAEKLTERVKEALTTVTLHDLVNLSM